MQCFRNGEHIPCDDVCNNTQLRFFFYLFGILTMGMIFLILMRPVVDYLTKKCVQPRNNVIENSSETETQGIQCDLEIGMQCVVINPDETLQLTDIE